MHFSFCIPDHGGLFFLPRKCILFNEDTSIRFFAKSLRDQNSETTQIKVHHSLSGTGGLQVFFSRKENVFMISPSELLFSFDDWSHIRNQIRKIVSFLSSCPILGKLRIFKICIPKNSQGLSSYSYRGHWSHISLKSFFINCKTNCHPKIVLFRPQAGLT